MASQLVEVELLELGEELEVAGELEVVIEAPVEELVDARPVVRHRMSYTGPVSSIARAPASMRVAARSDSVDDSIGIEPEARFLIRAFPFFAVLAAAAVYIWG